MCRKCGLRPGSVGGVHDCGELVAAGIEEFIEITEKVACEGPDGGNYVHKRVANDSSMWTARRMLTVRIRSEVRSL